MYIASSFQIVRPVSALIIVDVQNDFISGTLSISNCPAGQNGEEVRHCSNFSYAGIINMGFDIFVILWRLLASSCTRVTHFWGEKNRGIYES